MEHRYDGGPASWLGSHTGVGTPMLTTYNRMLYQPAFLVRRTHFYGDDPDSATARPTQIRRPQPDRRPRRLTGAVAAQHDGAEPGKARRGPRPDLSASTKIRARRQSYRRQPPARTEPDHGRSGAVLF